MGLVLLIAFIATPIIEIALFIQAGEHFGLWPTLAAVILTAIIGTALLRWQGLATWMRATRSLQQGVFPVNEVFTGLCLVAAGVLLLTPGFMTDAIGFALFIPAVRNLLARFIKWRVQRRGNARMWVNGEPVDLSGGREPGDGTVIDGEYEERKRPDRSDDPPELTGGKPNPDSPWRGQP